MSQFLSVGSKESCSELKAFFPGEVQLFMDISNSPFGHACIGNSPGRAYLTNVLDLKRTNRNGPDYFTEFQGNLYRFLADNPSVYVLYHWVSGEILKEEVTVLRRPNGRSSSFVLVSPGRRQRQVRSILLRGRRGHR